MFGISFREQLVGAVKDEFESLTNQLRQYVLTEHDENGKHGNVTATGDVVATGLGTFAGQHRALVWLHADQTVANNGAATLSWTQEAGADGLTTLPVYEVGWNNGPLFDSGNPTYLTVKVAGLYIAAFTVEISAGAGATGSRYVEMSLQGNGTTWDKAAYAVVSNTTDRCTLTNSAVLPLLPGHKVFVAVSNTGTGANITVAGNYKTRFSLTKVG